MHGLDRAPLAVVAKAGVAIAALVRNTGECEWIIAVLIVIEPARGVRVSDRHQAVGVVVGIRVGIAGWIGEARDAVDRVVAEGEAATEGIAHALQPAGVVVSERLREAGAIG